MITEQPADSRHACQVVILGAGPASRGQSPSAVADVHEDTRVIDWLLAAFGALGNPRVFFVAGYKAAEVISRYPTLLTVFNPDWRTSGPVLSLALAPVSSRDETFVSYADIVFRPSAVMALREAVGDVVLAVDSCWRGRYERRSRAALDKAEKVMLSGASVLAIGKGLADADAHAEFAGLFRLSAEASATVFSAMRLGGLSPSASIPDLIQYLLDSGWHITTVDLKGDWAELDEPQDLARFVLGTKAESLLRLSRMSHGGEIGEIVSFTLGEWTARQGEIVERVLSRIPGKQLIVRSSSMDEDGWSASGAGRYESVSNVERAPAAIARAVNSVFASYGSDRPDNQVLVQEMLQHVIVSGVVMTRTHTRGAPYYVLNFDDRSTVTGSVTSGAHSRAIYLHRDAALRAGLPLHLNGVLEVVKRLEELVGHDSLDIEFAVTPDQRVHILQVRPIVVTGTLRPVSDEAVRHSLFDARRFLGDHGRTPKSLVGTRTRYSVMADWNPAEIIGTKPRRLAFSLYRYLITDDVWARQRAEYGYRDVRPSPVLVGIAGHPYIDVRASFTSFVPVVLPDELAGRLVDSYLARLAAHPTLHDKVEFDILFTCLSVDFDRQADVRLAPEFGSAEIAALKDALRTVTEDGIERTAGDFESLRHIDCEISEVISSSLPHLEKAYRLLEVARGTGTLTFAHLARSAFVATTLLRSLQAAGAITAQECERFLASIETVLGRLQKDGIRVANGHLAWEEFVEIYGHLRPGTYDISSPCYSADAERYLRPLTQAIPVPGHEEDANAIWPLVTRVAVGEAFRQVGLQLDADRFEAFARAAIAGREEGKFVFTRALSAALECLAAFGAELGLKRSDLAHVEILDLLACRDRAIGPAEHLIRRANDGRDAYNLAQSLCLPAQIATEEDLFCFEQEPAQPNFVTARTVEGPVVAHGLSPESAIAGHIVLIPSADPGYDWLLAGDIRGLITMYGGANSHMAVRAAELSVPAAIGVGELLFAELEPATAIRLDCASRTITRIH